MNLDSLRLRRTEEGIAGSVCRFSVNSLCGLKHDQPESVPSYVSINETHVCGTLETVFENCT